MKTLLVLGCLTLFAIAPFNNLGVSFTDDNYEVTSTTSTRSGATYEVKCTDCGKYITVYYKSNADRFAQGDSPWYTQYRSLEDAAANGCNSRCD